MVKNLRRDIATVNSTTWPVVKSVVWQTLEEDSFEDVRFLNEEVQEEQMVHGNP